MDKPQAEQVSDYQKMVKEIQPYHCKLVAVSKTKPVEDIMALYDQGHRDFGENRVQEMVEKAEKLPDDIRWHFIGHLQRNKVKYIIDFVHLIHSIDSLRLLKEVEKQARKAERVVDVLLQFKIAEEDTKYGLMMDEVIDLLGSDTRQKADHLRIVGVMGMGTLTDDQDLTRHEFKRLAGFFQQLKTEFFDQVDHFREISMGMSGDYTIALEEGSTMLRIGSALFGARDGH